mmetsp:Transcript_97159/g.175544  ORF Transcript_97159/g.175544 Transcript_97159/m.175544 type:complete len:272 (-) Transcript_97159:1105-1920(-)
MVVTFSILSEILSRMPFTCLATCPAVRGWKVHSRMSSSLAKMRSRRARVSSERSVLNSCWPRTQMRSRFSSSSPSWSWPFRFRFATSAFILRLKLFSLGAFPEQIKNLFSNWTGPVVALSRLLRAWICRASRKRWRNSGGARRHTFRTFTERSSAWPSTCGQAFGNSSRTQRPTNTPGTEQSFPGAARSSCSQMLSKLLGEGSELLFAARTLTVTAWGPAAATAFAAELRSGPSKTKVAGSWSEAGACSVPRASMGGNSKKAWSPFPPAPS